MRIALIMGLPDTSVVKKGQQIFANYCLFRHCLFEKAEFEIPSDLYCGK
jgi:hypothetical protein